MPFDEQRDHLGVRIVDQEIQIVGEIEADLVAGGDAVGEAQAAVGGGAQPELQGAARLERRAHRARREAAKLVVRIGEDLLVIAVGAHAVRARHLDLAAAEEVLQPGAALVRLRIGTVAHRGRIDRRGRDAGGFRILQHAGDADGRHDDHRVLDRLRRLAQRRHARLAEHFLLPWIDQDQPARIAEVAQVAIDDPGPGRPFRSPDDRDRLGPEDGFRRPKHSLT